jgi:hypothetical protein
MPVWTSLPSPASRLQYSLWICLQKAFSSIRDNI